MKIIKFGAGARIDICKRMLEPRGGTVGRLMLLPIPTTRDGAHVSGSETELSDVAALVGEGDFVAGYGLPCVFREELERRGAVVYDAGADEEFLLENAKITAHGTLGRILTECGGDISELFIGIIGYGRIGSVLAELLLFLGARVRIYSSDKDKVASLAADGADARLMRGDADFSPLDILINTAPARPFSDERADELIGSGVKIIELASGKNFNAEGVVIMASVPDKMYPKSAGRLYANSIIKNLGL